MFFAVFIDLFTVCPPNCSHFVRYGGLKTIFALLVQFTPNINTKINSRNSSNLKNILLSIQHLFFHLSDSDYARLINKFYEKDFEKTQYLIDILEYYLFQYQKFKSELQPELTDIDDLYEREKENGLSHIELCVTILAFLKTSSLSIISNIDYKKETNSFTHQINTILGRKDISLDIIEKTILKMLENSQFDERNLNENDQKLINSDEFQYNSEVSLPAMLVHSKQILTNLIDIMSRD
jgi:hypothetical protein